MLKILLKKQMLELFHLFFRFGDGKKKRSKGAVFGYAFLMLYLVAVFFFQFYLMMNTLCAPLVSIGLDWLYFTLAGILALALSVIGSIFMTQSILYEAKDNEQLLSLPIPPRVILLARMLGLYLQNLLFCSLVLLPVRSVCRRSVHNGDVGYSLRFSGTAAAAAGIGAILHSGVSDGGVNRADA